MNDPALQEIEDLVEQAAGWRRPLPRRRPLP